MYILLFDNFFYFKNMYLIIKKATELWENNSKNIDDMTLIVIFFTFL